MTEWRTLSLNCIDVPFIFLHRNDKIVRRNVSSSVVLCPCLVANNERNRMNQSLGVSLVSVKNPFLWLLLHCFCILSCIVYCYLKPINLCKQSSLMFLWWQLMLCCMNTLHYALNLLIFLYAKETVVSLISSLVFSARVIIFSSVSLKSSREDE